MTVLVHFCAVQRILRLCSTAEAQKRRKRTTKQKSSAHCTYHSRLSPHAISRESGGMNPGKTHLTYRSRKNLSSCSAQAATGLGRAFLGSKFKGSIQNWPADKKPEIRPSLTFLCEARDHRRPSCRIFAVWQSPLSPRTLSLFMQSQPDSLNRSFLISGPVPYFMGEY